MILSINSRVCKGLVGNSMVQAVLNINKIEHMAIDTINYSHIPNTVNNKITNDAVGSVCVQQFEDMINNIIEHRNIYDISTIAVGYIPSIEIANIVRRLLVAYADAHIICDPVMGNIQKGFYIDSEVAEFIKKEIVPLASIITPNAFETNFIIGPTYDKNFHIIKSELISEYGPLNCQVIIKGIKKESDIINILFDAYTGKSKVIAMKNYHALEQDFTGSGDMFFGYFIAYVNYKGVEGAFECTVKLVHDIISNIVHRRHITIKDILCIN